MCSYDDSEREFFDFIASIFGWKSSLFGSGKISESDSSDSLSFVFGGATDQKKKNETKDTPKLAREQ